MADVTINNLTGQLPTSTDVFPFSTTGVTPSTYKASLAQIKTSLGLATVATTGSYNDLSNKPSLATVATTGSYTDLINKPTIPQGVPVGAVFHLATSTVPVGYLKCNGLIVPNGIGTVQGITADFSSLYSVLGTTYGAAGTLPDLRGEFIRGFDDSRSIDPSRVFGSYQKATVIPFNTPFNENYVHGLASGNTNGSLDPSYGRPKIGLDPANKSEYPDVNSTAGPGNVFNNGDWINDSNWGGGAIRPRNIALMPVIKY